MRDAAGISSQDKIDLLGCTMSMVDLGFGALSLA